MARLNIDRQTEMEPKRIKSCLDKLTELGIKIHFQNETEIQFYWRNHLVYFFPYSGWHSGSTIKPGRGFHKLIKQLTTK